MFSGDKRGMCVGILDVRVVPVQGCGARYLLGTGQTRTQEGDRSGAEKVQ